MKLIVCESCEAEYKITHNMNERFYIMNYCTFCGDDFIYSKDVARGMLHMVESKINVPVNLGSGKGVTIKEISEIIADYFSKEIVWDTSKPMGDKKRLMSMKRAHELGFVPTVSLKEGIHRTINWYKENINEL